MSTLNTDMPPAIGGYLNTWQRLHFHATTVIAVIFLVIYAQMVCPLMDNLPLMVLLGNLGGILLAQVALREILLRCFPISRLSPGRLGFYLSVLSWLAAGVAAWTLHNLLYPNFPWHSHVKLMVGYWVLGGGMLAQLDYAILERRFRQCDVSWVTRGEERLARRLLEAFTVFAVAPAVAMGLLALRMSLWPGMSRDFAGEIVFLSVSFVALAMLVAYYWGQTLREDTDRLLAGLDAIGEGRFEARLEIARADELGRIARAINQMAEGLNLRERIREAFGYFVSPEIAERFIQEHIRDGQGVRLGGERCEVTVLMCDLRDFTPLSEQLSPEELTNCLNGYFGELVGIIRAHGGIIDKFIGDAIMAVFGLVPGEADPALSAVQAAQAMVAGMARVNAQHPLPEALAPLRIGVGIHTGEVVAGYIGSPDRLSFTVVGRTVNIAARLEAQAKPPHPPILFSAAVARRITPTLGSRVVATLPLKGLSEPMEIHGLAEATDSQISSPSKSSSS